MTTMTDLVGIDELIWTNPDYRGGRPHIAGTGISVAGIAVLWEQGFTAEEIAYQKSISPEQAYAALAYYLHNKAVIDADLEQQGHEYDEAMEAQRLARARGDRSLG